MRSKTPKNRTPQEDSVLGSLLVSKIINRCMKDGKKSPAAKQVYSALSLLKEKTGQEGLSSLESAIENIKPQMEVRSRRIGGAAYQVPTPVRSSRRESLAIRWLVQAARSRPSKEYHTFSEKLAAEVVDAMAGNGSAVKKKLDMHRMAEANKAFAHFRW